MQKPSIKDLKLVLAVAAMLGAGFYSASAALMAIDNAGNSAYNDGWQSGDNGGNGFAGWDLNGNATHGFFIGSSTGLGAGSDINVGGKSFGMYANGGVNPYADAVRNLSGQLSVGQQLSFAIAVNFRNGNKGVDLRDGSGNSIWNFNVGNDAYSVLGNSVFGNQYNANTVFSFDFVQNATTLDWTVTRSGGLTGTASGTANIATGTISGLKFYVAGTGTGSQNDFFFNSLEVVPEPTTIALGIFGFIGGVGGVWRWQRARASA